MSKSHNAANTIELVPVKSKQADAQHLADEPKSDLQPDRCDPTHADGMKIARRSFQDFAETFKSLAE